MNFQSKVKQPSYYSASASFYFNSVNLINSLAVRPFSTGAYTVCTADFFLFRKCLLLRLT